MINVQQRCVSLVQTLNETIVEIGEWSKYNFGDQKGAGALAPLAGIMEEFLCEYNQAESIEEEIDSVSDTLIFLGDALFRSGVTEVEAKEVYDFSSNPEISLGKLCHVILKRHQGIRGYDDYAFFKEKVTELVNEFLPILVLNSDFNVAEEFKKTWSVVKQRDWTKNKKTGE